VNNRRKDDAHRHVKERDQDMRRQPSGENWNPHNFLMPMFSLNILSNILLFETFYHRTKKQGVEFSAPCFYLRPCP
jgi:hypothetical protein